MMVSEGVYIPPAKRRRLEEEQRMLQQQQQQIVPRGGGGDGGPKIDKDESLPSSLTEAAVGERASGPDPANSIVAGSASASASALRQRTSWDQQRRAIYGSINRLNTETIKPILADLFSNVNLVRMRGVFAKSLLQAALSNQLYAPVYASCVAVLSSKLPEIGELVVARAILAFRTLYRRKDRSGVTAVCGLLGHLFHQNVVHELLILQILTLLLDGVSVTDDSVEVAATLLSTVGYALLQVSPVGVRAVTERLRSLLHEGELNHRVQYKIEKLLELRKTGFRDKSCYPPIPEELDLVEADDQITFELSLDDDTLTKQDELDVFRLDPDFDENEATWAKIRAEVLGVGGEDGSDDDDAETASGDESGEEQDQREGQAIVPATSATDKGALLVVQDLSDADLVHLRRQIYLTIMSAAGFEETAHKLAKMNIPAGREEELVNMLIECCSQEKTFQRHYGMIAGRFCLLADRWRNAFMDSFVLQYSTIHRLETNKLRNVAKLFAHLLHTDALPWSVLSVIHLNEDETTSSSRIFLKILVQEMTEALGMARLKERFDTKDPEKMEWYKEIFPTDNVRKTRYAINFFTSIGLGPLTDGLREFLKNAPKLILQQAQQTALAKKAEEEDGSESDSSSSSSSGSSTSTSSSSSSSSSRSSRSSSSRSSSSSSSSSSYSRRGRGRERSRRRRSRSESSSSSSSSSSSRTGDSSPSRSPLPRGRRSKQRSSDRKRRSLSASSSSSSATSVSGSSRERRRDKGSKRGGQRGRENRSRGDDKGRTGDRRRSRSPSIPDEVVKEEARKENKARSRGQSRSQSASPRSRSASPVAGRDRGGSSDRKRRRHSPSPSPEDSRDRRHPSRHKSVSANSRED